MKTINLSKNFNKAIKSAADVLQNNKIIIYPTDTLYGLGGNALSEEAVEKVFGIKKRDRKKPLPIIAEDLKMARRVACIDSKAEEILKKIWSADSINKIGPVTAVLRKKDIIPYILTGNSGEFLDPIFSSGVTFATETGLLAAKLVTKIITEKGLIEKPFNKNINNLFN